MLERIKAFLWKRRRLKLIKERLRITCGTIRAIDMGFVKEGWTDQQRVEFFIQFFGDLEFQNKICQEIINKHK